MNGHRPSADVLLRSVAEETLGFAPMRRFPSGASAATSAMSWPSLSNNLSGLYSRIQLQHFQMRGIFADGG